jgi:phosphoglycolate phosphatase-like HAD superfamily hydrolase
LKKTDETKVKKELKISNKKKEFKKIVKVKKNYKLILFDFDGTILDVLPHIVKLFNQIAKENNFKPITDITKTRSLTLNELIRVHKVPLFKIPSLISKIQKIQLENIDKIKLVNNIKKIIPILASNYKLGILSSNSKKVINTFLKKNDLLQHFNFIISYPRIFSKSVALTKILLSNRLRSSEILYVGDEVRDIQATKLVNIDIVAVTWGINSEIILKKYKPNYLIKKPNELLKILN